MSLLERLKILEGLEIIDKKMDDFGEKFSESFAFGVGDNFARPIVECTSYIKEGYGFLFETIYDYFIERDDDVRSKYD